MSDEKVLHLPNGDVYKLATKRTSVSQWAPFGVLIAFGIFMAGTAIGNRTSKNDSPKPSSPSATTASSGSAIFISQPGEYYAQQEAERKRELKEQAEKDAKWKARPLLDAPSDAPPSLIKVGPYFYSVHWTSAKALESQGALALTNMESREIWLNPKRIASLRDDMLHELMHCSKDLGTGGGRFHGSSPLYGEEEIVIEGTSAGLLQVMQDNAELVEWLRSR